jgi:Leucine-rich repeat (LRR) protein
VIVLLVAEATLWLSDRLSWPAWHKGYAVLVTLAGVGLFVLLVPLCFLGALILRWRFQFSIRSLFILTVAVAFPFSWLAAEMKKAREQRATVDEIRTCGGLLSYDWELESVSWRRIPNATPPEPAWLRKLVGGSFFESLAMISLDKTQLTDAELEHLTGLSQLRYMSLGGTKVTDAGLEYLGELRQLRDVSLNCTKVTDAGLEHLTGLSGLHSLSLYKTEVTDAGLEDLKVFSQLQWLWLDNTAVTDAGLEHLKGLSQLQWLGLTNTRVTDAGLEHLKALGQLERLWLRNSAVTDAGLEHLKGLSQLHELALDGTKVTDAGLEHLKGLSRLGALYLRNTKVTDAGVVSLQQALPNCGIETSTGVVSKGVLVPWSTDP